MLACTRQHKAKPGQANCTHVPRVQVCLFSIERWAQCCLIYISINSRLIEQVDWTSACMYSVCIMRVHIFTYILPLSLSEFVRWKPRSIWCTPQNSIAHVLHRVAAERHHQSAPGTSECYLWPSDYSSNEDGNEKSSRSPQGPVPCWKLGPNWIHAGSMLNPCWDWTGSGLNPSWVKLGYYRLKQSKLSHSLTQSQWACSYWQHESCLRHTKPPEVSWQPYWANHVTN